MFRTIVIRILALLVAPLCLLTAWITGITETYPENLAQPVDSQNFGLFEAVPRYQGVTTDGESWYYSWNFGLIKTGMDHKITALNFIGIPWKYIFQGNNHIGGISYWDGKIYCPLEDSAEYLRPYILIYDAKTLKFTGKVYELPWDLHTEGVPWVAVDGPRGVAYTAEWSNAAVLNVFNLEDFSLVRTQPLSAPLDRIQGSEVWDGILYCASDNGDEKTILAVDPLTGEVTKVFDRNLGQGIEAEGMTVRPMADGSFFHCIETGSARVNVRFNHYAKP
jgi:hypothetical protein